MKLLTMREFHFSRVDFYVDDKNDFWVTQEQIGNLLGYFRTPEKSIKQLHEMCSQQLFHSFKEVEINARYKGLCKTVVYNADGLIQLCVSSGKKHAAELVNFFWEMKREFHVEQKQENLPALQILSYSGNQVRMVKQDDDFWFVAKDVCDILGLTNPTEAIKSLADDEKMTLRNSEGQTKRGGAQFYNVINEPGVYRLVFRSNKPEAEKFKHWIFHEVLPSLRKTGSYSVNMRKRLTDKFHSADELAAELGLHEYDIVKLASDNDLLMYGFTNDCEWYFTEEGREKILNAARL